MGRRFAVGEIENADRSTLSFEQQNGSASAEFRIVWMGRNYQIIQGRI